MNVRRILKLAAISFLAGLALGAAALGVIMWKIHSALEDFGLKQCGPLYERERLGYSESMLGARQTHARCWQMARTR
ncbi:MAG: hypothetical protein V1755_06885 [Chloroflexota bacterium]